MKKWPWLLFVGLVVAERLWPLRPSASPRRWPRNLAMAGASGVAFETLEAPAARWALQATGAPATASPLRSALSFAALDYTLYLWHVLTHRVPFLWRMHAVHHMDEEMDWTTAARFHALEMTLSVPYRVLQIVVIRPDRATFEAWNTALRAAVLFHHSNLRLPMPLEEGLLSVIVTPRMHGLHHARRLPVRDTNWGTIFSLWDRLHGTLHWQRDQLPVGVDDDRDQPVLALLTLPLRAETDV